MVIGLKSSIEASITRWEMNHERPLSHLFEETWIIKESKIHNHFHNRKEYFSRSFFFSNPLDKIIFTQFIYGNVRDLLLIRFAYRSIREDKIDFFSFLILTFRNQFRLDLSYLDKPYENDCPRSSNIYFDNLNFELPEIGIFVTRENANFSLTFSQIFRIFIRRKLCFDPPDSQTRIIYSSSSALLRKKAQFLSWSSGIKNVKRSENCQPIVRTCHLPWKSGNRSFLGLKFSQRRNGGMQEGRRGGENQRLTSSAWHWLKFVFRQRIKIVPTLSSRRGRYSITHVACQLSNKGQTRKKKRKKGKK